MTGIPAAFEPSAFQNDAFQTGGVIPPIPPTPQRTGTGGGMWRDDEGKHRHHHVERYSYGRSNNQVEEIARHIAALLEPERVEPELEFTLQPVDQLLIQRTMDVMRERERITLESIERVLRQMIRELEEDDDDVVLLLM